MRNICFLAIAILCAALPAQAGGVRHALKSFGLLGHWAQDCALPASGTNNNGDYAMLSDGTARLEYAFGATSRPQVRTVTEARILDRHRIRLKVHDEDDNTSLTQIIRKRGTRIQVESSIQSDGKVIVSDGVGTYDNGPVVWLTRCRQH